MGSGKTAVGKHLARPLHLTFYDSDVEIEQRTGVDIPYIFEKEGEAGFREREREVIDSLTQLQDVVIATGGGAVLMPENRERLASRGCVVYLQDRIQPAAGAHAARPTAAAALHGDPEAKLRELMEVSRAAVRIHRGDHRATDGRQVRAVADEILAAAEGARSARHERSRRTNAVDIALGERSYPILIGPRSARRCRSCCATHITARSLLIVTNETIAPLYLAKLQAALHGSARRRARAARRRAVQDARQHGAHHRCAGRRSA